MIIVDVLFERFYFTKTLNVMDHAFWKAAVVADAPLTLARAF